MSREVKLQAVQEKVAACMKCPALVANRTQTVFGSGNPNASIVFIGEGPGKDEDEQGLPFVGKSGQLLTNILTACGIKREDVYILNIVKCRPPGNRAPQPEEASNCRLFLELQLRIINPKYIVCLGAVAAQNLLQTETKISALRGEWHVFSLDDTFGMPVNSKVLCTWHPSYLLRNPAAKIDAWNDMQILLKEISNVTDGSNGVDG